MNLYRHGDLLLRPTKETVRGTLKTEHVLAYGEVTGHRHLLRTKEAGIRVQELPTKTLLQLIFPGTLTHEEHKTLTIPAGNYELVREREFDPFESLIRQVAD